MQALSKEIACPGVGELTNQYNILPHSLSFWAHSHILPYSIPFNNKNVTYKVKALISLSGSNLQLFLISQNQR